MPQREPASEIEDAATVWVAKAERGLTEADQAAFEVWVEGDSRRLGAYVRAQAAWIHAERAVALGRMPEPTEAPLLDQPSLEALHHGKVSRRMALGGGSAIAASLAAAYLIGINRYRTLESGVGEIRHIALDNRTKLTLDTDTRVDVASASASADSTLELVRGKLFMAIKGTRNMPLIVHAGGLVLETMAGAFSVENLLKSPVVALVTDGRLTASQSQGLFGQKRTLTIVKDQVLTLPEGEPLLASDVWRTGGAQQAQLLAWRDGMLSFGGEFLADAVREFDRYGSARIIVLEPELARQKVTGLFKADDPKGFATAVAASFGGVVTDQGDIIRITVRKVVSG